MSDHDSLVESIIEVLGATAVEVDEIVRRVRANTSVKGSAADIGEDVRSVFQFDTRFSTTSQGVMFVPAVVNGTEWTVWVDAADALHGFVRTNPHLDALGWWLIQDDLQLIDATGNTAGVLDTDGIMLGGSDTDVVIGPDGWLDALSGGWASVTVIGNALKWRPCPQPPDVDARQAAAVRAGFRRAAEHTEAFVLRDGTDGLVFTSGDAPILEAVLLDRQAFVNVAIAPLPELFAAAGLESSDSTVAESGFDWEALEAWRLRQRMGFRYGLEGEQVELLMVAVRACQAYVEHGDSGFGDDADQRASAADRVAALLDGDELAMAFWDECGILAVSPVDVGRFALAVMTLSSARMPCGLGWLLARSLDDAGDVVEADALLRTLASDNCQHRPLLLEAASFAADRGDAAAAYRLLRQAGVSDVPSTGDGHGRADVVMEEAELLMEEVRDFATHRPKATAGRNDPCPCGSGRKYKSCHLGNEQHALSDRSVWLYDKARRYVRTHDDDEQVEAIADVMCGEADDVFAEVVDLPVVADVALHEGGMFAAFLAARSALLPDDEALLAAQWSLVDRGLFEIRRIERDRLHLHNVGQGEDIIVVNTHPSSQTRVGTLMFGRPLPVGAHHRALSGFMLVQRSMVNDLLAAIDSGDPMDIAEAMGPMFRPHTLRNTDGHELLFHTVRWSIGEPHLVDGALQAVGWVGDGGGVHWHLQRGHGAAPATVIASLELVGNELVGEVNSAIRAAVMRESIAQALPGAELLDTQVRTMDDMARESESGEPDGLLPSDDPDVSAAIAEMIADYERRWLDDHIPALGGRTPRDAVADPVGREELMQLFASFPPSDPADLTRMSADRLRAALGL